MSEAINFDSYANVQELVEAGVPEKQAAAIVTVQARAINANTATKQDLAELETRMTVRMVVIGGVLGGIYSTLIIAAVAWLTQGGG